MTKPAPIEGRDRSTNILILRAGIAALSVVIVVGAVYYIGYYYRIIFEETSEITTESINPLIEHQLTIRVRQEPDLLGVEDLEIYIEEYGTPPGRNLISTSVETNSTGTAIVTLLTGQYTVRPVDNNTWRGLESVNLDRDREVTLLVQAK